jgi:hypothetical protein
VQRLFPALALSLLALCVVTPAAAGDVYHWKDAHGVTQYSSTPPAKGKFKSRPIRDNDVQATTTPAKPTENPACAIARKNVELLQGKAAVQIDSDGDGKPDKTLSDADRGNQRQLAEATLKVNCATAVADKAAAPVK